MKMSRTASTMVMMTSITTLRIAAQETPWAKQLFTVGAIWIVTLNCIGFPGYRYLLYQDFTNSTIKFSFEVWVDCFKIKNVSDSTL